MSIMSTNQFGMNGFESARSNVKKIGVWNQVLGTEYGVLGIGYSVMDIEFRGLSEFD